MRALIHLWSDYLCPYCYLERPVLEEAAREFGSRVAIRWHAFELRPAPAPLPEPDSDYISEHWHNRVLPLATARGIRMRVPKRQVRSRRALQAALFAQERGRHPELDRRLFRARFEEDADISDVEVLKGLGRDARLDPEMLAWAVSTDAYADELAADVALAARLGIEGVPAALIGLETSDLEAFFADAEPVVGAVPYELFAAAIERAFSGDRSQAELRRRPRPIAP